MNVDRTKLNVYYLWRAIYPMPLYQVIQGLVLYIGLFPDDPLLRLGVSGILSILVFGWIYREDVKERCGHEQGQKKEAPAVWSRCMDACYAGRHLCGVGGQ